MKHQSAKSSHYDGEALHYDLYNEKNSLPFNQYLETILRKYRVKSVLDLTCGTGSQVFYLAKKGFYVVGIDINDKMLKIAKRKAIFGPTALSTKVTLLKGDMRSTSLAKEHFDAAITIFNAIGHLTKKDFEKALKNIFKNLKEGGIYIFDIFNLDFYLQGDNISKLTIDWIKKKGHKTIREVQYSTLDRKGILTSYTTHLLSSKIKESVQTLQIYSLADLKNLLHKTGFKILQISDMRGEKFNKFLSDKILIIAKR